MQIKTFCLLATEKWTTQKKHKTGNIFNASHGSDRLCNKHTSQH